MSALNLEGEKLNREVGRSPRLDSRFKRDRNDDDVLSCTRVGKRAGQPFRGK